MYKSMTLRFNNSRSVIIDLHLIPTVQFVIRALYITEEGLPTWIKLTDNPHKQGSLPYISLGSDMVEIA